MNVGVTRREFAALAGATLLSPPAAAQTGELITRAIPGSGERLPAVGLGTAYVFDRDDEITEQKAAAVVQALVAGSGSLINEIRTAIWAVNSNLPLASVRTLSDIYDASMVRTSFALVMFSIAAISPALSELFFPAA